MSITIKSGAKVLYQWERGVALTASTPCDILRISREDDCVTDDLYPVIGGSTGTALIPDRMLTESGYLHVSRIDIADGSERVLETARILVRHAAKPQNTASSTKEIDDMQALRMQMAALERAAREGKFDGKDGTAPHIGENGNWWLGDEDTGIAATGADGITPHIGANGNWFLGEIDLGVRAQGEPGDDYVLTDADKTAIAEEAAEKLQPWIDKLSESIAVKIDEKYLAYDHLTHDIAINPDRVQKSQVTENDDGTLTIAAGGYYFVGFEYAKYGGAFYVGAKYSKEKNLDVAFSTNGTSSANPFEKTETVNGCEIFRLPPENRRGDYPYVILRFDNRKGTTDMTVEWIKAVHTYSDTKSIVFVSPDGSDSNIGTEDSPYATVNQALATGASVVNVMTGIYEQRIDFANAQKPEITIQSHTTDGRPIFVNPDRVITNTETLVSGYTKVFSASTSKTFDEANNWIFQDGVNDVSTLITDEERHPLQRGYEYRCHDTKIVRCTSTVLADALAEIESSNEYKWYFDGATNTIYFSRPEPVSVSKPICGCFNASLTFMRGLTRKIKLNCVGIEVKYMIFSLMDTINSTAVDCKASNVYGAGAFRYDRAVGVKFIRCEAARAYNGSGGDGFNGHADNTGDIHSKQTTATFIDCWAHDNADDGYSDHERSETTIIGGLFEYNCKGGVVPAGGSHCTCYNVLSRRNYRGFLYTNTTTAEEGGKGGQLMCIGCVADNNNRDGNIQYGFVVSGEGNSAILIDCKSIGHKVGYSTQTGCKMRLVDCGSLNDATVKSGDNIVVENTTPVT